MCVHLGGVCEGRVTFLNMMSEPTDRAVNKAAMSSIMTPTGILALSPIRAAIQPLETQGKTLSVRTHAHTHFNCAQWAYFNTQYIDEKQILPWMYPVSVKAHAHRDTTHHVPQPVMPIDCSTCTPN